MRFLDRNISATRTNGRIHVDGFKKPDILLGASWRLRDLSKWKHLKKFALYCFMPYSWLNRRFLEGRI